MIDNGLPIWVGEFGPLYTGDAPKDEMRYRLLKDQLAIYVGLSEEQVVELSESFNLGQARRRSRLEAILSGKER